MYLITAQFRPSRSKLDSEKPGVVFYRITGPAEGKSRRPDRDVNSNIHAVDSSVFQIQRAAILEQLRLLYCVIERKEDSGQPFTIDDVADDFRKALNGDDSMKEAIARSQTDFPFRSDIVSVGREFKGDFKFIFTERSNYVQGNVYDFIFNQSQTLKNESRFSQSKNFLSLLSNLQSFADKKDINFKDIDAEFIHRYSDWLEQTGISGSTQSFYLSTLRVVLNKAHSDGLITSTLGWFNNIRTRVQQQAKISHGNLSREIMLRIESLDLTGNNQVELVRDMFMFGFYCGGMELVDIANLTYSNIKDRILTFRRRLKGLEKKIVLGEQAMQILNRYKSMSDNYLFPLLSSSKNVLFLTVRNYVNQSIKVIGNSIDYPRLTFNMNITAYNYMLSEINIPELLLKRE